MDDHLLKAQTMRGSPYVKAFEDEMQAWESKLISMQDILESWLTVFSSTKQNKILVSIFPCLIVPKYLDVS